MGKKEIFLDIDYHDLCWAGDGSAQQLEQLFDTMQERGWAGALIDCFQLGEALYHSGRFRRFSNRCCARHTDRLVARLAEFDPLRLALRLARERNLRLLPYLRLFDESFSPWGGNAFFREHPEYFMQSRCGNYRLDGMPCFAYAEVREHFLERAADLLELGFSELYIGASRAHARYFSPWVGYPESMRIFGFNPPVAEEYFRRTGVDLRRIGWLETRPVPPERQLGQVAQNYVEYFDTPECDYQLLRRIAGEGVEEFLRGVKQHFPGVPVTLEAHHPNLLPGDYFPDNFFLLDQEMLVKEALIDRYITSSDWATTPGAVATARHMSSGIIAGGVPFGLWLNDILSGDGGMPDGRSAERVRRYVDNIRRETFDFAVVHEALYITSNPAAPEVWSALDGLLNKN